ncbi:MAG: radical SAM family heme chaperone HemW [Candidatus Omnitrophica bacterium]|nr:radical SAM family heme chaperone HemW [Candidatus Omnitrophota bacterium]
MAKYSSLYIHVPFCKTKCDYCAFYSYTNASNKDHDLFFKKLISDLLANKKKCSTLQSIFIGGGTPTLLPDKYMKRLFEVIKENFLLSENIEVTIEANPETLTDNKISFLGSLPINRISIGIQSFSKDHRQTIGRKSSVSNIKNKLTKLRKTGIKNINIDLIYGIPGQSIDDWKRDLKKASKLPIKHLSAYELTLEESSKLSKNKDLTIPDEKDITKMWKITNTFFYKGTKIKRYEISNYAKKGYECLHNCSFWEGATYLGLGPSAVSFDGKRRIKEPENFTEWLNNKKRQIEFVSKDKRTKELFMLNLRTTKGIDMKKFYAKTGINVLEKFKTQLTEFKDHNLLKLTNSHLVPTRKGLLLSDHIAKEIL